MKTAHPSFPKPMTGFNTSQDLQLPISVQSIAGHAAMACRMVNIADVYGLHPFTFADALLGILAQRLAKKLCGCKQPYHPDAQKIRDFIKEYAEELRHTEAWKADPGGESQKLFDD